MTRVFDVHPWEWDMAYPESRYAAKRTRHILNLRAHVAAGNCERAELQADKVVQLVRDECEEATTPSLSAR